MLDKVAADTMHDFAGEKKVRVSVLQNRLAELKDRIAMCNRLLDSPSLLRQYMNEDLAAAPQPVAAKLSVLEFAARFKERLLTAQSYDLPDEGCTNDASCKDAASVPGARYVASLPGRRHVSRC